MQRPYVYMIMIIDFGVFGKSRCIFAWHGWDRHSSYYEYESMLPHWNKTKINHTHDEYQVWFIHTISLWVFRSSPLFPFQKSCQLSRSASACPVSPHSSWNLAKPMQSLCRSPMALGGLTFSKALVYLSNCQNEEVKIRDGSHTFLLSLCWMSTSLAGNGHRPVGSSNSAIQVSALSLSL